jgi:hypothetical protein
LAALSLTAPAAALKEAEFASRTLSANAIEAANKNPIFVRVM